MDFGTDSEERKLKKTESKNVSAEKLFFVGDEKQSIYKFRGADVSVFNELKKSLKDNSGSEENVNLNMTNNYRSSVPLLYSFNLMFGNCDDKRPLNETEIPSLFYILMLFHNIRHMFYLTP